jgi:hypothetical protein
VTAETPTAVRSSSWLTAVALVMVVWLAGLPLAFLLILLVLQIWHLSVPLLFVGWAVVSIALTVRVRRRAGRTEPEPEPEAGRSRAAFGTLRQRAALLMNTVLLVGVPVGIVLVLVGGLGFSLSAGAQPGLVVVVVGGFVLLAAAVPTAVLNALWSLDRVTAVHEAAVLRGDEPGSRRTVRFARTVAWISWSLYGAMALLLLVQAVRGAF